jgi:hypothetical protein
MTTITDFHIDFDIDPATVDDTFFSLMLSDPDLVRAEFDTLVAGEWAGPPPDLPESPDPPDDDDDGHAVPRPVTSGFLMDRRLARPGPRLDLEVNRWRRQRSPPINPIAGAACGQPTPYARGN